MTKVYYNNQSFETTVYYQKAETWTLQIASKSSRITRSLGCYKIVIASAQNKITIRQKVIDVSKCLLASS